MIYKICKVINQKIKLKNVTLFSMGLGILTANVVGL